MDYLYSQTNLDRLAALIVKTWPITEAAKRAVFLIGYNPKGLQLITRVVELCAS